MPATAAYPQGTFCWADLPTSDPDAAKAFYGGLFGWDLDDRLASPGMTYAMASKGGEDIGAIYRMGEDTDGQGAQPRWQAYVSVEDADGMAARARELGATIAATPFDVQDKGRMAVLVDPGGAHVSLWQPASHAGFGGAQGPGAPCWFELHARDARQSADFYGRLFGWTAKTGPSATGGEYTEFLLGDRPVGGMLQIQPIWGEVPPKWTVYFAVADFETSKAGAEEAGGRAITPPIAVPGVGRFVYLHDPQGAVFAILEPAPEH